MAALATKVICDVGDYNLFTSSCQDFCQKFLRAVGCEDYFTDLDQVLFGTVTGVTVVALVLGGMQLITHYLSSDKKKSKK